jgi:hypothetical protein
MPQGLLGLLVASLLTALLGYQAVRAAAGSRLRQTYGLATAGFGLILALNFYYLLGLGNGLIGNVLSFVAVALLIGAVASFGVALFNGEFGAKLREAQDYTGQQREQIAQQRAERERSLKSEDEQR